MRSLVSRLIRRMPQSQFVGNVRTLARRIICRLPSGARVAQNPQSPKGWIFLQPTDLLLHGILVLLVVVNFLTSSLFSVAHLDDQNLQKRGTWQTFPYCFYDGGTTAYSSDHDASLTGALCLPPDTYYINVNVYNYGLKTNRLRLRFGSHTQELDYGPNQPDDQRFMIQCMARPDKVVRDVAISIVSIGQPYVNIDSINIYATNPLNRAVIGHVLRRCLFLLLAAQTVLVWIRLLHRWLLRYSSTTGLSVPSLDGLRGVAAFMVVMLHCSGFAGVSAFDPIRPEPLNHLVGVGHKGVAIFFILSAFTLYMGFYRRYERSRTMNIREYFRNRIVRILPLYILIVAICALARPWILPSSGPMPRGTLAATLTLAQIFRPDWVSGIINHSVWWSISTECQFYLLLPLLFLLMFRFPSVTLLGLLSAGFTCNIILHDCPWYPYSVVRAIDSFAFGLWAAHRFMKASRESRLSVEHKEAALIWLAVSGWLLLERGSLASSTHFGLGEAYLHDVLFSGAIAQLTYHLAFYEGWLSRLLGGPVLQSLGVISYGVYLLHVPLMFVLQRIVSPYAAGTPAFNWLTMFVTITLVSATAATLLYRCFEYPILKYARALPADCLQSRLVLAFGVVLLASCGAMLYYASVLH